MGRYRCGQRPEGLKAFAAAKTGRLFKAAWLPTRDAIIVVGIDRLGRNAAEVMTTIRDLSARHRAAVAARGHRHIERDRQDGGRCWRAWPSWSWNWGVNAARRPEKRGVLAVVHRTPEGFRRFESGFGTAHVASGEAATAIAAALGVSRATVYRVLADSDE